MGGFVMKVNRLIAAGVASLIVVGTAVTAFANGDVTGNVFVGGNLDVTRIEGTFNQGFGVAIGAPRSTRIKETPRIELIKKGLDLTRLSDNVLGAWYEQGVAPADMPIFIMDADEQGHYEFKNIPAGDYFMVVVAPRMGDGMADLTRTRAGVELSKYLPNWNSFAMFTGGMRSCVVKSITVRDGESLTMNYDLSGNPFTEK